MAEQLKGVLMMFIAVVVALPMMIGMISLVNPQTELSTATNESIDISSAYYDSGGSINESKVYSVEYDQDATGNTPISSFVLGNLTDDAIITTDYVVNTTAGTFTLKNSTFWLGENDSRTAYADYNYKASSYLDNSFPRLITGLILGILALVLVAYIISRLMGLFEVY